MRVRILFALSALGFGAATAHGQQVAYAAIVMAELDSATRVALNREIGAARDRGLPTEALVAKVREGQVKRASMMQIRTAVSSLAKRLDSARAGLGPTATPEELAAGAEAITHGATVASLRALRAASPRQIAAPIGTFAQMLINGVEQRRAVEMMIALLRRNATPAQVLALGNQIEADVRSGIRPEEAALFRLRGIEGNLGMGDKVEISSVAPPGSGTVTSPPPKPHRSP